MLTQEQIARAENFEPGLTENAGGIARADTGKRTAEPALATFPGDGHNLATTLLRGMFDRNLKLAGRMLDIGDCSSAKRLLQSAITQCEQIGSYGTKAESRKQKSEKGVIEI